ncbi:Methyltransferase-like protein 7A [Amphibalanus amphitrite]|uniref:Methyltransferase-like protein 7A n=1 Tax=Amphibalanus amphitrite TaxID=1232801 RepID=A0A6A4VG98_AMPAM|nr:methyltransferase-like protein 7A [Amphibalanus amphitrite]XP_043220038.1 methyltransferase-like protein 7A [Amphibalanus amphitrite]KAF0292965.1 Methyltransferase-like protein 7A [Amphibalanus amphitrite]
MLWTCLWLFNWICLLVGWLVFPAILFKIAVGAERFKASQDWLFAFLTEYTMKEDERAMLRTTKLELFSSLKDLKSADPELLKKKALNILEIGVGTGQNLEFYPPGSKLTCIDPNKSFEVYFRRECEQKAAHLDPNIRFVVERGESMPSVADGSVDVVVISLVLCSVPDLDQMFREIRRVLVPGGKFYFLEHSTHRPGTWRHWVQEAVTNCGLWPFLMDGCVLNKDPAPALENGGFSDLEHHTVMVVDNQMKPASATPKGVALLNPFCYGVATK